MFPAPPGMCFRATQNTCAVPTCGSTRQLLRTTCEGTAASLDGQTCNRTVSYTHLRAHETSAHL
eukprot:7767322-Alexandrium_andersonii.AAC.1